jgi:hypothetical protein
MKQFIVDKDLGDLTAERDRNLSSYFVDDIPAFKLALDLNSQKYILMGRTGSGKSSIIRQIIHMCDERDGYTYSLIDHSKHDLDFIVNEARRELQTIPDNIEYIIFKLSWHYTIVINILRRKYSESPLQSFKVHTDLDKMVYDFLKHVDTPSIFTMTIADLFLAFVKLVKLKGTVGNSNNKAEAEIDGTRMQSPNTYSNILKQTEIFIQKHLREVIGGDKLYILIDDLDIGWNPSSESQQKLMSALFSAINVYLNEPQMKPIVALRTDIFKGLKVHQREKYQDLILKVEWTEQLLKNFLVRRISTVYEFNDPTKVPLEFFRDEVDGRSLIDHMIGYTLNRPRDLLDLCKLAIKVASTKKSNYVLSSHIEEALDDYSVNRVIALEDEWKSLYNNIESLIKLIAQNSTLEQVDRGYSTKEFHKVLNDISSYLESINDGDKSSMEPIWFLLQYRGNISHPQYIVSTLYDLGIIYLLDEGKLFKQASESNMPKITITTTIKVHPMFSRYMKLMIHEEESPWLLG